MKNRNMAGSHDSWSDPSITLGATSAVRETYETGDERRFEDAAFQGDDRLGRGEEPLGKLLSDLSREKMPKTVPITED